MMGWRGKHSARQGCAEILGLVIRKHDGEHHRSCFSAERSGSVVKNHLEQTIATTRQFGERENICYRPSAVDGERHYSPVTGSSPTFERWILLQPIRNTLS